MNATLSEPYRELVSQLIATGRYETEGEVVRAGLRLLEEREALRIADPHDGHGNATVRELIDEGDAAEYADWNPERDFAAVRAELQSRLNEKAKRKAAGRPGAPARSCGMRPESPNGWITPEPPSAFLTLWTTRCGRWSRTPNLAGSAPT